MLASAARLLGSSPRPSASTRSIGATFTARRIESFESRSRGLGDPGGDELPPRLVGRDAQRLRRFWLPVVLDGALPALPREFVVVADADERPPGARVLDVRIGEVAAIHGAIALERGRHMEVADLASVGNPADLVDGSVVAVRDLLRIFDDLVDEVAQVQHEVQPLIGGRVPVFPEHAPPRVLLALVDRLAGDEGEADRSRVVSVRCGDGPADATAVALGVDESIPVDGGWLEARGEHPAGPIGFGENWRARPRYHLAELRIERDLGGEHRALRRSERPARPQNDAVWLGVTGCDAFRKEVASLSPPGHCGEGRPCPGQCRPDRGGSSKKITTGQCVHDCGDAREPLRMAGTAVTRWSPGVDPSWPSSPSTGLCTA